MTNIIPFEFESNKIRTVVDKDNTIWFVSKDVAEALGYVDAKQAVRDHCMGVSKQHPIVDSLGRTQKARVITEPDVYRLIVKSKLPSAQKFERKIFEEILPTLRKTGSYSVKPKKSVSPSSYMKVHQFIEQTLTKAGLKENQLLLATNRGVAKLTGFDLLSSADIKHLPSPDNDEYLTPTEIGKMLDPIMRPKPLNRWLTSLGLQEKQHDGKGYLPTPQGEVYGGRMMDVAKAHGDGSIPYLKWNSKVIVPYLQNKFINNQTH
ncbi:Phage antirepressor protein [Candidatus Liberibacter solanacearum]|uniref:Phage antirepressor protein n=1 Tax=Candidatus Liberibacter solanacearum TaxID=556287 RepID=A0A0F4VJY5_9HYPH|nr:Bro-N domain-containing protein [Candidatus Liberibacter solanacearum]KJZ81560.1 Phage antirepressor protein [Candidatus Liberibacter solanacearum]